MSSPEAGRQLDSIYELLLEKAGLQGSHIWPQSHTSEEPQRHLRGHVLSRSVMSDSFPPPGDLPDPGIEPVSPAWQVDSLPLSHRGGPPWTYIVSKMVMNVLEKSVYSEQQVN